MKVTKTKSQSTLFANEPNILVQEWLKRHKGCGSCLIAKKKCRQFQTGRGSTERYSPTSKDVNCSFTLSLSFLYFAFLSATTTGWSVSVNTHRVRLRCPRLHHLLIRYHNLLQKNIKTCLLVFVSLHPGWVNDVVTGMNNWQCVCTFKTVLMTFCGISVYGCLRARIKLLNTVIAIYSQMCSGSHGRTRHLTGTPPQTISPYTHTHTPEGFIYIVPMSPGSYYTVSCCSLMPGINAATHFVYLNRCWCSCGFSVNTSVFYYIYLFIVLLKYLATLTTIFS